MENRSFRKSLAVAVILLFLLSSLIPLASGDVTDVDNTIIVDDEGDGDYTVIQDAIDNASDGDTIFVYSGVYEDADLERYENTTAIPIRNITLWGVPEELGNGNDTGKPVIDGNDRSCIHLSEADGCIIQGFELFNGTNGITLFSAANNTIANNTIHSCDHGIEFNDYRRYGIFTANNIVKNNNISKCWIGIENEGYPNNIIRGNLIKNCSWWGIFIDTLILGNQNIISNNRLLNNGQYGPEGGIAIFRSFNCIIEKNHFESNVHGVLISGSFFNIIRKNNFIDSKEHHATFVLSQTIWNSNFWGEERILPQPIFGMIWMLRSGITIPWVQFDWHPAKEPYDIPTPEVP